VTATSPAIEAPMPIRLPRESLVSRLHPESYQRRAAKSPLVVGLGLAAGQ